MTTVNITQLRYTGVFKELAKKGQPFIIKVGKEELGTFMPKITAPKTKAIHRSKRKTEIPDKYFIKTDINSDYELEPIRATEDDGVPAIELSSSLRYSFAE